MTKSDHPTAAARVKLADKMVMPSPLFDGTKPEVVKQHYERFNQYIKFQTKSSNIRDPIGEAIELFKHSLDKKALVWFQEHKDKFVDLTTLKTMFLQRYNPWGKTKQDQLQSWNILTFNPQKTDVDEHIDLINTLSNMLGQTEESKRDKFIDTMPTIIQTHLITENTWQEATDKAKELKHIIRKCDPPTAALPMLAKGTTVPGLCSYIAHSGDKEKSDIPQPFKGAWPKHRKRKGQSPQKPKYPPVQTQDDSYNYDDTNNYYHTENYRGQSRGCRPSEIKIQVVSLEAIIFTAEVNKIRTHTKADIKMTVIKAIITRAIEVFIITHAEIFNRVIITAIPEAEAMAEVIIMAMVTAGPIIEEMPTTNTISIMAMMMSTRQISMVYHVPYVVDTITLLNIVSRESMISMILWKR